MFVRYIFFKLIGKDVDCHSFYDKEDTDMIDKQSVWNIFLGFVTVGLILIGISKMFNIVNYKF